LKDILLGSVIGCNETERSDYVNFDISTSTSSSQYRLNVQSMKKNKIDHHKFIISSKIDICESIIKIRVCFPLLFINQLPFTFDVYSSLIYGAQRIQSESSLSVPVSTNISQNQNHKISVRLEGFMETKKSISN
jgi:hypothetical protein